MEWHADGYVLAVRRHGEASAIVEVLTREHGRCAGLVRGASGKRLRGLLQPGNLLHLSWRARLSEHLGMFVVEDAASSIASLLDDPLALSGLSAACAMICITLPEREAHARVFDAFAILVSQLHNPQIWPALFIRLESGILVELGYGLDFSKCAATGVTTNLTHVSPRTGRAVCAKSAEPYLDKLLPLPGFLTQSSSELEPDDIKNGLALTAHFLEHRVLWPVDKQLPDSRERMIERLKHT
ncbi:MAG: DNA repair protein RecO [Robiginitomaculum sp.]|nr:DNA repair protein RecO [Robiginitomaculum sp.]